MTVRSRSCGAVTGAKVVQAKLRAEKALQLRAEGRTFREIASEVGYNSVQAAHEAVKRALKELVREPAEDVLHLELERLDRMWGVHYLNAQAGDVQALGACIRLMERRAKLLGLDAPEKSELGAHVVIAGDDAKL